MTTYLLLEVHAFQNTPTIQIFFQLAQRRSAAAPADHSSSSSVAHHA